MMEKRGVIDDHTPPEDDAPLSKDAAERHEKLEDHVTTRASQHAAERIAGQDQNRK